MEIEISYLRERFDAFNKLCFGGSLPQADFRLSRAKTYLGRMEYRGRGYLIRISTAYELPEHTVEDVLLHEMIHEWLHITRVRFETPHGRSFRRKMEEINRNFGRNITIRYKVDGECAPHRKQRERHIVCISTFPDGKRGITVLPENNQRTILRSLSRRYDITSREILVSTDPFLNRYPVSRKGTIYRIEDSELEKIVFLSKNA